MKARLSLAQEGKDMEEIERGEYIRNNKIIAKVIGTDDDNNILLDIQQILTKPEEKTVKHSKQLIDLIEVGDLVNGYKVINVINEGPCPSGKCVDMDSSKDSSECTLWEEDIETILTKESYMANCYKVGGEKC